MPPISFEHSYAELPDAFYSSVQPDSVPTPELIKVNEPLAETLGFETDFLHSEEAINLFSGNKLCCGADAIAMAYAGHQFGGWSPQLGDGRAALIGELTDLNDVRYDVQLKGAGRTPYSRGGDGKAGIGPVLREYILSEAMAALGVPTTRALAAVSTGEMIMREEPLPGAVFTRVAQSHVRVGTFQYFASLDYNEPKNSYVKTLADYVVDRHYPDARESETPYQALLRSITLRQAELIAQWMSLGFIHGVMNTDNMQVVGETIDYGPCAFMDVFHPEKKFSSIDRHGRYAWNNQPAIGQWNLSRLAEAFLPLLESDEDAAIKTAEDIIGEFMPHFHDRLLNIFALKTGLSTELDTELSLGEFMQKTFITMTQQKTDFTLFFRSLTQLANGGESDKFITLFEQPSAANEWLKEWENLFNKSHSHATDQAEQMKATNPIYIPRNHRVEQAIDAGLEGDFNVFHELVRILYRPYDEQPDKKKYEYPPQQHEEVKQTFCGT